MNERQGGADSEQYDSGQARGGDRDLRHAEQAVAVDQQAHHELAGDQDPDRRGRPDPRLGERDGEDHGQPHHAAQPHPRRRPERAAEPTEAGSRDEQDREREQQLHACRERQRLDDADAATEAAHHRHLHGAGEAGQDGERDGGRGHYAAFGSFCQRANLLPSVSTQLANQPCVGTGCLASAVPPSSRTFAAEASMSSVEK